MRHPHLPTARPSPTGGYRVEPDHGLLGGARFVPSPNQDERPPGAGVEVLIIHAISLPPGEFGGVDIERLFCNALDCSAHPYYRALEGLEVSAHLLIRRDGEVVQFVPFHRRAWHAGVSSCEGRSRVNDFSIGIELEGTEDRVFEPVQYAALAAVTRELIRAYPLLSPGRIYGHADIAPGRKSDPGPHFDWQRYRAMLA
jgi:AmpD protein